MSGTYFLLPTLIAVAVSMLVVRAGAIAFVMTGMSMERAKFQALSCFSGTGFTTREAERVVNHPTRRRIATWLIILGNAGIVTVIVTGTSTLAGSEGIGVPINALLLVLGIAVVYVVLTRTGVMTSWESFVEQRLGRSGILEERPIDELLHLLEGYGVRKLDVTEESELAGRPISDGALGPAGLLVLGIEREGEWIPAPTGSEKLEPGDRVVVYGHVRTMERKFRQRGRAPT